MKFIFALSLLLMGTSSANAALNRTPPLPKSSERENKVQKDVEAACFEGTEKDALDKLKQPEEASSNDVAHQANSIPDLEDLLLGQLLGSMSMYGFAKIRDFVRNDPDKNWYRPELILTQTSAPGDAIHFHRFLKHPVSVAAQFEFVSNPTNWKYLKNCKDINTDEESHYNIRNILDRLQRSVNLEIVEFDDQFADKNLVYGITVNRTKKRITVLFRGSVVGGEDWTTNANALYETLQPTRVVESVNQEIKVHRGFQSYLFAEQKLETGKIEKFEEIVSNIRGLYEKDEFKGYSFGITGHSLGGALTQLLAYHLGASGAIKDVIPGPITAISFASPQVGNEGYNEAFQELERNGLVHHLRISNEGDVVPVGPFGWGYTQTGVNMHLKSDQGFIPFTKKDDKMDVGYRNLNSQVSQISIHALANHSLERYYHRLMVDANKEILATETIQSLYDKYAAPSDYKA